MVLYLSYFYKANELSLRLSFWWASIYGADIIASLLGFALLHLRGHDGKAGWRWLFFIEVYIVRLGVKRQTVANMVSHRDSLL
jgi:hypothetical protein